MVPGPRALLATDLDQRLLPDVITLPMIPLAFVYALTGKNPLVGDGSSWRSWPRSSSRPLLYLPSMPFGPGAFGLGDVKLLVGVGLLVGGSRALGTVFVALLLGGVVIVVLLATRRIGP